MVGGPADVVDRCRPVLETFGDPVLHVGPLGSGQEAKVLNNTVFAAQLALAAEVFELAAARDLDQQAVATILASGSGRSYAADVVAGGGFDLDGLAPLAGALLAKDVGILVDRAELRRLDAARRRRRRPRPHARQSIDRPGRHSHDPRRDVPRRDDDRPARGGHAARRRRAQPPLRRDLEPTRAERPRPTVRHHRVRQRRGRRPAHGRARVRRARQRRPHDRAAQRAHAALRRVLRLAPRLPARDDRPRAVAAPPRGAGRTDAAVPEREAAELEPCRHRGAHRRRRRVLQGGQPHRRPRDRTRPYFHAGILNFVFGHLWQRPGLTRRERRLITIPCVGVGDAIGPIWSHVTSALGSGDVSYDEMQEIILHFSAYGGVPRATGAPRRRQPMAGFTAVTTRAADAHRPARRSSSSSPPNGSSPRTASTACRSGRSPADAGSANNSAVHYHFGSKQGLIAAIFRYRLPQLISERRMLAARCDPDDLRSRFEAHFLPVFTLADTPDTHYVSFVEQLQRHDLGSDDALLALPPEGQRSHDEFRHDLDALLGDLDEPLRRMRIVDAQSLCIHAAADRERAVTAGIASTPFELYVNAFLDGITGFLSAPASRATQRRLDQAPSTDQLHLRAL